MPKSSIFVAFGANLPVDPGSTERSSASNLRLARSELVAAGFQLLAQSQIYVTPCFPAGAGPDYVNAVSHFHTDASPDAVLQTLHAVEARHGRTRISRWAGRTLDLDLLAYDDLVLPNAQTYGHWHDLAPSDQARLAPERLILPHPRLQDRGFVLVPFAEIAPGWMHPVLRQTAAQLLEALQPGAVAEIKPLHG